MREGIFRRIGLFAVGVVTMTLLADIVSILASGNIAAAMHPDTWWHHAKFLATFIGLVMLGGAFGLGLAQRKAFPRWMVPILGGVATMLAYGMGLVLAQPLGLTASLLAMIVVAAAVAPLAGRFLP